MERGKLGCYAAFCAEHKGGRDAISLMKCFKECDVEEAQRLKRKWEGRCESAYSRYCQEMRGSGLSAPQLSKRFRARKEQYREDLGGFNPVEAGSKLTFGSRCITMLRGMQTREDLRAHNQTGYKYIIYDNRGKYAHMAFSYSIMIGKKAVRSKGYASAELAADALLGQIRAWLTEIDARSELKNTTYTIPSPPRDWQLHPGAVISVNVANKEWAPSVVEKVYADGWFSVKIEAESDSWEDHLNWQEEGSDWKRELIACPVGKGYRMGAEGYVQAGACPRAEVLDATSAAERVGEDAYEEVEVEAVQVDDEVEQEVQHVVVQVQAEAVEPAGDVENHDVLRALSEIRKVCAEILSRL